MVPQRDLDDYADASFGLVQNASVLVDGVDTLLGEVRKHVNPVVA